LAEAYKVAALDAWNKMRNINMEDKEVAEFDFDALPNNPFDDLKSA